ncbi:MAG: GNAT family N-acetyltransferase [Anaerolineae bacterium]|nr:GNAT family N-acetyltransferase [Anaerolineae bacterium]
MDQSAPLRLTPSTNIPLLVSLLLEADESPARVRSLVEDQAYNGYLIQKDEIPIGAVLVHWQPDESEIIYIAVDASQRGKGYGKAAVATVLQEARQRGVDCVLVGTANAGIDQIAFYQKCGFRMDSVRKDYFDYFAAPVYENGILIQDMLVLRYQLA